MSFKINMDSNVQAKFDAYPESVRTIMLDMRALILCVAEDGGFEGVEETLKWGEPSYLVKGGSPVRIDWKPKSPDQYCFYFNCKSKLVDTFRELYGDVLGFEGNRAIVLTLDQEPPLKYLRHCIELAMTYQKKSTFLYWEPNLKGSPCYLLNGYARKMKISKTLI